MTGLNVNGMEAKTLGDLIDLLQDLADEYPEHVDSYVLIQNDKGDVDGVACSVDLDPTSGPWIIFEEAQ